MIVATFYFFRIVLYSRIITVDKTSWIRLYVRMYRGLYVWIAWNRPITHIITTVQCGAYWLNIQWNNDIPVSHSFYEKCVRHTYFPKVFLKHQNFDIYWCGNCLGLTNVSRTWIKCLFNTDCVSWNLFNG